MARTSENDATAVYEIADKWRKVCLIDGKSLLWSGEEIWSEQNLADFKKFFNDKPDVSSSSFGEKFKHQLEPAGPNVTKLACELVLVYFLFPSSVTGNRKRELIELIASWKNLKIEGEGRKIMAQLDIGIGGPGLAYNTRRPFELMYLGKVTLRLAEMKKSDREALLSDHLHFQMLLDAEENEGTRQSRDILLHLLFPEVYERIASRAHKRLISETFADVVDQKEIPEDLDEKILAIRKELEKLIPGERLDFYWPPLRDCWYVTNESDELNPLEGLSVKRQIVLYGPPGTGKTHEARDLADRLVRQGLLHVWGPGRYFRDQELVNKITRQRVRRVQLHPGYSYEDFVRGIHLAEGGQTEYRDGVLLQIIMDLNDDDGELNFVPFVLILDEMNRADLSKVLGECFSLLEDRDMSVQLAGLDKTPREVSIPSKLHFIGTMNLIDQSLEQVDFALRRRFLWYMRGFSREQFLTLAQHRWNMLRKQERLVKEWHPFEAEFEILADRAEALNMEIERHPSLGAQYQIGHTYFCDVVSFIEKDFAASTGRVRALFRQNGHGREQTIGALWKYSLKPLLEQYLSGIDTTERKGFIDKAEVLLISGSMQ